MKLKYIIPIVAMILAACGHPSVPENATKEARVPQILPDYTEVTIPANICPLNFAVKEGETDVVARLSSGSISYTYGDGEEVCIDESEWAELRDAAKGGSIKVEIFAKINGTWKSFDAFSIYVAEDDIDQYISYRLIQPSYVAYEKLKIAQRDLTSFEETDIYNNMEVSTEEYGQCINCHSYQNYKTDHMLFHLRQYLGGTVVVNDGEVKKIDMKTEQTISAGVYPSWHPTQNIVAFSTNNTGQSFHTKDVAKIEVQDTYSDLILYDVEKDEITTVLNDSNDLEVFPCWSADGNTLYYCSAYFVQKDSSLMKQTEMMKRYKEVKYNVYALPFDQKTRKFGERELIFDADSLGKSATLPRVSPDGRYLVFSLGEFGCFHVWHKEADIYLLDLKTREARNLKELNSDKSESYPSFSSNGRWIMADSRRDDGNYTRPYISYFDKSGKCHKAFELPQKEPNYYTYLLRSYNRPEFMVEPVKVSCREFVSVAKGDAKKVKYVGE